MGAVTRSWTWNFTLEDGEETQHNPSELENSYIWTDGAQTDRTVYLADVHNRTEDDAEITEHIYDGAGHLIKADIDDGQSREVDFTNDLNGQVIEREVDLDGYSANEQAPRELWYRYGGREMGYTGNNGTTNLTAERAISQRARESNNGIFSGGQTAGGIHADFDQNYEALNSYNQGSAASTYTVQGGETLTSIAAVSYTHLTLPTKA